MDPLIRAAYAGNVNLCELLLIRGADPNKCNLNGTTPLMYAFSGSDRSSALKIVQLLSENGADLAQSDHFGKNLKHYFFIDL